MLERLKILLMAMAVLAVLPYNNQYLHNLFVLLHDNGQIFHIQRDMAKTEVLDINLFYVTISDTKQAALNKTVRKAS